MSSNYSPRIAYFCMEYGLDNKLHIYSGGLGILAGDFLKSAKDLCLPAVGIGILWRKDYTTQLIGEDGYPYDIYPNYDFKNMLTDTGVSVNCNVRGENVKCKVWKVDQFENTPLYLLDASYSDDKHSWMTKSLYGGLEQDRVAQEIILGIGGIRALRALNIDIDIYHFNEGHAVFAAFELIKEKMAQSLNFMEACQETKKEVVFTTHTPVEAGNETHDIGLLMHMEANNGLSYEHLHSLGGDPFNMTAAALRLSNRANAVSQLHGKTANNMWENIKDAAPIRAITNGVHVKTWQSPEIYSAYKEESDLWKPHIKEKERLLDFIKHQNGVELDINTLTIGFARRAAAYKRGGLIFKRMDLLDPLLQEGRLQLIYSGKAHPNDFTGKEIIKELILISRKYPNQIVFLENYNMLIASLMVQGCDMWLNNPIRPMEASGTSGMKAALNGVLNISVLDGWVGEALVHQKSGWLLDNVLNKPITEHQQDNYDIEAFYEVLLNEALPIYHNDRSYWLYMMKESIKIGLEKLTSERMVKEYYKYLYNEAYNTLDANVHIYNQSENQIFSYQNPQQI